MQGSEVLCGDKHLNSLKHLLKYIL